MARSTKTKAAKAAKTAAPKPTRAPKTKTAPAEKTETQRAGQISQRKLKILMSDCRKAYKDSREIAGELGNKIRDAVENENLHKKAFAVIRSADRMEPEKLAEFFDCLDYYRDISGLNERASKVMRMDFDDDGRGNDDDGDDGADGDTESNVRPFPAQTSVAAE